MFSVVNISSYMHASSHCLLPAIIVRKLRKKQSGKAAGRMQKNTIASRHYWFQINNAGMFQFPSQASGLRVTEELKSKVQS
jgi:hypothetical protein